ncbi:MAG: SPOR domain-containing protein, partial [Treponema sp.]|nr:SPOR domain-containing protein [Treponema sp.]
MDQEKEKEKKKLLLVAVSVGVFLVIIISAAILIFTARVGPGPAMASSRPIAAGTGSAALDNRPASLDALETVRNAGDLRGIQNPPVASAAQETDISANGENPSEVTSPEQTAGGASAVVTITVPKPTTAAVPDAPVEAPRAAAARPAASV